MASLLLMNFLDVARSLGRDPLNARPDDVSSFLKREYSGKGGGLFNYNPAINLLPPLFRGHISLKDAENVCATQGAPAGRTPNADAIRLVGAYAVDTISNCYKIPFAAVPIGRLKADATAYMSIKAPLVRVSQGGVYVVVPGFRLGHRPEGMEIDVAASLALATFGRDDFAEADYEYLDCSRGLSGERELRVYQGQQRRIFDLDEVDHMLDIYVRGLDIAISSGMAAKKPNFRGYHVIDPNQPSML